MSAPSGQKVNGFDNLFAMEVDPKVEPEDMENILGMSGISGGSGLIQELTGSLPGIDEAMSFAEVMKYVPHYPTRNHKIDNVSGWCKRWSSP